MVDRIRKLVALTVGCLTALAAFTASCFRQAREATDDWTARVQAAEIRRWPGRLYSLAWKRWNRQASMPDRI